MENQKAQLARYPNIMEQSISLIKEKGECLRDVGSEDLVSFEILRGVLILQLHASENLDPLWRVYQIQEGEYTFDESYEYLEEALKQFDVLWLKEEPASLLQTIHDAIGELLEGGVTKFDNLETVESAYYVEELLKGLKCSFEVIKEKEDVIIKILD